MLNKILNNSGAQFPIKVGNKAEVHLYASRLVNGECQLLITYEGELYLAKGDATYIEISGSGIDQSLDNINLELVRLDKKIDLTFETLSETLSNIQSGNLEKITLINANIESKAKIVEDLDIRLTKEIGDTKIALNALTENVNVNIMASIEELKEIVSIGKRVIVNSINLRDPSLNADITNSFDELGELITRISTQSPIEPLN